MRLALAKVIRKEDLGADVPAALLKAADIINPFIEQVVKAFDQGITFRENFLGSEITVDLTHNTELEINPASSLRVKGVLLVDASGEEVTAFRWRRLESGNIGVRVKYESAGSTKKTCVLQVQLGR